MLNRVRLPFYLSKPQYPAEEEVYLKGNGQRVVLKSIVSKVMDGKTDYMPYKLHERLTIALRHDEVNIENENFTGSIRMAGAYDIAWIDFLDYPVAQASFKAFEEEFVARSNKCDICDPANNLSLEDDFFESNLDEGTEYSINVATNDNICCDSPVFYIESFDTDIIDTIDIDQTGVVTLTLKTPIDSFPDHLLFTYKVICGNGVEDTANVYGTVEGSLTTLCEAPSGLALTVSDPSSAEIHAEWTAPGSPPTDGYEWILYDETGTIVISSGTTTDTFIDINSLDCDTTYKFKVRSICDLDTADVSAYLTGDILIPNCDGIANENAIYSHSLLTHCAQSINTVYTDDGTIVPGKTIYIDAALTVKLIGYSFISDLSIGVVYNLNSLTAVVGSNTGMSC